MFLGFLFQIYSGVKQRLQQNLCVDPILYNIVYHIDDKTTKLVQ